MALGQPGQKHENLPENKTKKQQKDWGPGSSSRAESNDLKPQYCQKKKSE
jgi:hypothetical protein